MPKLKLNKDESNLIDFYRSQKRNGDNILVVGDIHEPFAHPRYLDFCLSTCYEYNCGTVIFIGDLIDNHYASYHESDPDGMSAGEELKHTILKIKKWHDAFPNAKVLYGNHDRLIMRKAYSSGISQHWLKDFKKVIQAPTWSFHDRLVINDIQFVHGEGKKARARAKADLQSTVQGHYHSDAYVDWFVGNNYKIFAMQTGCGVDRKSYAMSYAKHHPKPSISVGLILNNGENAMVKLMDLENN